jgi:hypothetical protein
VERTNQTLEETVARISQAFQDHDTDCAQARIQKTKKATKVTRGGSKAKQRPLFPIGEQGDTYTDSDTDTDSNKGSDNDRPPRIFDGECDCSDSDDSLVGQARIEAALEVQELQDGSVSDDLDDGFEDRSRTSSDDLVGLFATKLPSRFHDDSAHDDSCEDEAFLSDGNNSIVSSVLSDGANGMDLSGDENGLLDRSNVGSDKPSRLPSPLRDSSEVVPMSPASSPVRDRDNGSEAGTASPSWSPPLPSPARSSASSSYHSPQQSDIEQASFVSCDAVPSPHSASREDEDESQHEQGHSLSAALPPVVSPATPEEEYFNSFVGSPTTSVIPPSSPLSESEDEGVLNTTLSSLPPSPSPSSDSNTTVQTLVLNPVEPTSIPTTVTEDRSDDGGIRNLWGTHDDDVHATTNNIPVGSNHSSDDDDDGDDSIIVVEERTLEDRLAVGALDAIDLTEELASPIAGASSHSGAEGSQLSSLWVQGHATRSSVSNDANSVCIQVSCVFFRSSPFFLSCAHTHAPFSLSTPPPLPFPMPLVLLPYYYFFMSQPCC